MTLRERLGNFLHDLFHAKRPVDRTIQSIAGYNYLDPDPAPIDDEARSYFDEKKRESEAGITSLKQDLEQMKTIFSCLHHNQYSAQTPESCQSFDDEWTANRVPATMLPAGWEWVKYNDGSGHLEGPNGQHLFSYDLTPYSNVDGVEFQENEASGWSVYWNNEDQGRDFWKYAEEKVSLQYLPQQEFLPEGPAPSYEPEI